METGLVAVAILTIIGLVELATHLLPLWTMAGLSPQIEYQTMGAPSPHGISSTNDLVPLSVTGRKITAYLTFYVTPGT